MGGSFVADPRPVQQDGKVVGARCSACRYPTAPASPWCPVCQSREQRAATFGPGGTVWASTIVEIPVGKWVPPYAMAYVDLDDGPRVIAHLSTPQVVPPGTRVQIDATTEGDDLFAVVAAA